MNQGRSGPDVSGTEFAAAEWLLRILKRWPVILVCMVAGGAVAAGVWTISPRRYVAGATVVVNHHAEKVLPKGNEYEVASYLNREAMRLEAIASSDTVWSDVGRRLADQGWKQTDFAGEALRGLVELPHPYEGSWQFVAYGRDPASAAALADAWSQAFVEEVTLQTNRAQQREAVDVLTGLEADAITTRSAECASLTGLVAQLTAYQRILSDGSAPSSMNMSANLTGLARSAGIDPGVLPVLGTSATSKEYRTYAQGLATTIGIKLDGCQAAERQLRSQWDADLSRAEALERTSDGVSAYVEVALVQAAQPLEPQLSPPAPDLIVGSLVGLVLGALVVLIWPMVLRSRRDPEGGHGPR